MSSVTIDWEVAHHDLVRIALQRAALEHALGKALLRALRAEVWLPLGMASFNEYAERFVGLTERQTEERLRVAHALEELPRIDSALAEGKLHFSGVRGLTRVAVPATEAEWLAAAEGKSVGEIEDLVAGHRPGDKPSDPPDQHARRRTLVIRVSAEAFATYREAQAKLRRESDRRLTEDEGILLMARAILGGPRDEGRSSYQIYMTMCDACGRTTQEGRGQAVVVDSTVAEAAQCDAQRMAKDGKTTQDVPPATRRLVVRRQNGKCAVPCCENAIFTDLHHLCLRSEGGTHDPDNLVNLCVAHHLASHRGALIIDGSWSKGLSFFHADGSKYGAPADVQLAEMLGDVYQALCEMGFPEGDVRQMVKDLRPRVGGATGNLEKEDARPS